MAWIRKAPFGRDEDAADFMISILADEAAAEGALLTEEERKLLRGESRDVTPEFESRIRCLVEKILKHEVERGETKNPRSFSGAIEWAGDMEYPYIVQVCESVAGRLFPHQPLRGWQWVKDGLLCIGCGILVVFAMFAILGILGILGTLR